MSFTLPTLKYDYKALEPYIDAQTMEIHSTKHHAAYTNNLNAALETSDLKGKSIEDIKQYLNNYFQFVETEMGLIDL